MVPNLWLPIENVKIVLPCSIHGHLGLIPQVPWVGDAEMEFCQRKKHDLMFEMQS
jgi:hypothetical protein